MAVNMADEYALQEQEFLRLFHRLCSVQQSLHASDLSKPDWSRQRIVSKLDFAFPCRPLWLPSSPIVVPLYLSPVLRFAYLLQGTP